MAQQTTNATTTIIEDLQTISAKILELSKTNKLPEQNAIELNKDLLKIYNKINNSQSSTQPLPPPSPPPPPPPLQPTGDQPQIGYTYTYTYSYNVEPDEHNEDNEDNYEEDRGWYGEDYDDGPRRRITRTITPIYITSVSDNLLSCPDGISQLYRL